MECILWKCVGHRHGEQSSDQIGYTHQFSNPHPDQPAPVRPTVADRSVCAVEQSTLGGMCALQCANVPRAECGCVHAAGGRSGPAHDIAPADIAPCHRHRDTHGAPNRHAYGDLHGDTDAQPAGCTCDKHAPGA